MFKVNGFFACILFLLLLVFLRMFFVILALGF